MKYMGSKNRHSKELLKIILKDRKPKQYYIEPFVGGFNIIDKVDGNRIAGDTHEYLIALFKAIQNGYIPPDNISFEQYCDIRNNKDSYPPELVGFVGFGCSFSGKWFGGYARGNQTNGIPRNYCLESKRNILSQVAGLKGIEIYNCEYFNLPIPNKSIIYCDPPYRGTTKYSMNTFDYEKFWAWCESVSRDGNTVFVSEYSAPENWKCIWNKEVNSSLDLDTGSKKNVERLFIYNK